MFIFNNFRHSLDVIGFFSYIFKYKMSGHFIILLLINLFINKILTIIKRITLKK